MESLKSNSNFKETHWSRLVTEIGLKPTEFNLKNLSFGDILRMNLQNYQEAVEEVVTIATQEQNNDAQLKLIEKYWKEISFEISEYKKDNDFKGFVIKVDEAITLSLNDHLIALQNMEGNKYAMFLRGVIRDWINSLNKI